jgi:hypothetical protein
MKNIETVKTTKNGNHNGNRKNTPAAPNDPAALNAEIAARLRNRVTSNYAALKQAESAIDLAFYHNENTGIVGIGFRKSDGKLVELCIQDEAGICSPFDEEKHTEEISLPAALEWLEQMDYAVYRFGSCLQEDPDGRKLWIKALRSALPKV